MKPTDQTLLEQMRITDLEIEHRKALFNFGFEDVKLLQAVRPVIEERIDELVARFYEAQTSEPDIALLIGDADTLARLRSAQRKYVLGLFSGAYNLEYVNNRLRIGLVHKRIGVEPKLYLAAVHTLKLLVIDLLRRVLSEERALKGTLDAVEKLIMFDIALVFETYIRSLVAEIETSKDRSEQYARSLEEKVRERTRQLEDMTRTDPLTGLLNVRHLIEALAQVLRTAQRNSEPVTVVYVDVNQFKQINDALGHQKGDEILRTVASALTRVSRSTDLCFRYGGDEFCIVLPNCREEEARAIYLQRLPDELAKHKEGVSVSTGFVETGPPDYMTAEELIREADKRMYTMKRGGSRSAAVDMAAAESSP